MDWEESVLLLQFVDTECALEFFVPVNLLCNNDTPEERGFAERSGAAGLLEYWT